MVAKPEGSLPVCMVTEASYAPVADGTNADEGFTTLVMQRIGHAKIR